MALGMSLCRCRFRHIVRVNFIRGSSKNLFRHKTNWDAYQYAHPDRQNLPHIRNVSLTPYRYEEELVCCKPNVHVPTSVSCHFSCFRAEYFFEFTVSLSRQPSSAHPVRRFFSSPGDSPNTPTTTTTSNHPAIPPSSHRI